MLYNFKSYFLGVPGSIPQSSIEIIAQNRKRDKMESEGPDISNNKSYLNVFYLIPTLILCVLFSLPLILVPQNNDIEFWEKRNDVLSMIGNLINYSFGFSLLKTFHLMFECKLFFKINSVMNFQAFAWLYFAKLLSFVFVPNITAYLFWNVFLGHNSVMPFNAYLGLIGFPVPYIALWIYYPHEFRNNKKGRRKFKAYMYYKCWQNFQFILKLVTAIIVKILPSEFQWVMAILLPMNREIDFHLSKTLLSKGPGLLDEDTKTSVTVTVNSRYALHVAITIGSKATTFTSCCILFVDFIFNLHSAYKIHRLQNKVEPDHLENQKRLIKKKEELRKLCLIEIIEIVVPIAYIITFLIAYYGPNAELFKNMMDKDVGKLVITVFWMFLIDSSSGVFGGIILSTTNINLLREGCGVLRSYGPIITLQIATILYIVSSKILYYNRKTKLFTKEKYHIYR